MWKATRLRPHVLCVPTKAEVAEAEMVVAMAIRWKLLVREEAEVGHEELVAEAADFAAEGTV